MSIEDTMSTLRGVDYRIDGVSLEFDGEDVDFHESGAYFTANVACEVTSSGGFIFVSPQNEDICRFWEVVRALIVRVGGYPAVEAEQLFDRMDELPGE